MTSFYPNQPGYLYYHDPTKVDFKVSWSFLFRCISQTDCYKTKLDYFLYQRLKWNISIDPDWRLNSLDLAEKTLSYSNENKISI